MAGGSKIINLIRGKDKKPRKMEETKSVYKIERQRKERGVLGRDNVLDITTRYRLDGLGFETQWKQGLLSSPKTSQKGQMDTGSVLSGTVAVA
jgi:hypothetical protein